MKRTVVVIGAGRWQIPLLQACRTQGLRTIAVDVNPDAPGFSLADCRVVVSAHDADAVLAAIQQIKGDGSPIVGVVTKAARESIVTTALLARTLGLPGLDLETASVCVDRGRLRAFLAENGFEFTRNMLVDGKNALKADKLGWPLVVKPVSGTSGSSGLTLVDNPSQLDAAIKHAHTSGCGGGVVLEEYLHGIDLSVFGFLDKGVYTPVAITERWVNEQQHFLPERYRCPWGGTEKDEHSIISHAAELVKQLGVTVGPINIEFRFDGGSSTPRVIEVEPSMPAHITERLISDGARIDIVDMVLQAWLAEDVQQTITFDRHAGCHFVYAPEAGRIHSVTVDDTFSGDARDILRLLGPGALVENQSATDVVCVLYATADSNEELNAKLDTLCDSVRVEME